MDINDILRHLSDSIRSKTCLGIVGAGLSASTTFNKKKYKGLPLANELLSILKKDRTYLNTITDLAQAAFLVKEEEGRLTIEKFICDNLRSKESWTLPAHKYIADLNLPCYISLNFDEMLENELSNKQIQTLTICSDKDVTHLTENYIPFIKPHGTISEPSSLRIATDEIVDFLYDIPIVSNLMLSQMADKTLLALGFSFSDPDLIGLLHHLKINLNEYMPRTYAVIMDSDTYSEKFLNKYNVELIKYDLTSFLFELNKYSKRQKIQLEEDLEPWLKNDFFWQLLEIRGKATETQVIDSLLEEIKNRLVDNQDTAKLKKEVKDAVLLVIDYRRNFHALGEIGSELDQLFNNCISNNKRPWDEFIKIEQHRRQIKDALNTKATETIFDFKNILLYSQSQRVVDLLNSVDPTLQDGIKLIIGECRPKSPQQFQDAINYARLLRHSKYSITFVPDVAMLHLLLSGRIDLVLLGAHMVYRNKKSEQYTYFVNTAGSEIIVKVSNELGIPVKIIFESEKIEIIETDNEINVSYEQEEDIATKVVPQLSTDPLLSEKVRFINIGYDLVNWYPNVIAVTDK